MRVTGKILSVATALLLPVVASAATHAQSSTNYKLEQHTLNAGGRPDGGTVVASANFRITLDAIGDAVSAHGLSGLSYSMDVGFLNSHRPPDEVSGLLFDDEITLRWDADPSAGFYNLYRATLSGLTSSNYGACLLQDLMPTTTTDSDPAPPGDAFFYLVTVENRLGEEGTRGYLSNASERIGIACP